MSSNRNIFMKEIDERDRVKNNQVKTTKSIITPEGKSIFIEEGKNHIQGADDIVEKSSLLQSLLIDGESASDLLYYLGFIALDEGPKKTLLYISKSLNEKTKERVEKLRKKIERYPDALVKDIYEDLDKNGKVRCAQVLGQYNELLKKQQGEQQK